MVDEQIIYLSPEEDLTSVRERLERIPSRRIILVVPRQTQLRSHLSWRLLYTRARELLKDILVVSDDRQIRSVAKVAGFRVADSLESPSSSKTRPGSRPGRTGLGSGSGGRTLSRLRTPPGRSMPGQQTRGFRPERPQSEDVRPTQEYAASQRVKEQNVEQEHFHIDDLGAGEGLPPASSSFEMPGKQFGQEFDYRIGTQPPVRPVIPHEEDEEPDLFLKDFEQAESIRNAARQRQADEDVSLPPLQEELPAEEMPQSNIIPAAAEPAPEDNPFTYMEDDETPPIAEHRSSIPVDEMESSIADISDYPADIATPAEIEDQGDLGDFVIRPDDVSPPESWSELTVDEEERPAVPRVQGLRSRASRSGKLVPPVPPTPPMSEDVEETARPIYDQPTRTMPPEPASPAARQSGKLPSTAGAGKHPPQAVPLPQARPTASPSTPVRKKKPAPPVRPAGTTFQRPGARPAGPSQRSQRKSTAGMPILVGLIAVLLMLGLLAYFAPSATVTITIPSQSYSRPITLTASATSRQDIVLHTLPAEQLSFTTSKEGTGHATGTTTVGTIAAKGNVVFTNNGPQPVDIPTGTIVATSSGIQFVTTADALVAPGNNNPVPIPVQAQNPGTSGNVAAGTITVIPASSLSAIQRYNNGIQVILAVTNPAPTSGGGAGTARTVASSDVNAEKDVLTAQAQGQINTFLKQHVHTGDQQGKPLVTVVARALPPVGSITTNGTFKETVQVHMTVLVVRASSIQAAAAAEMNEALKKQKPGYALVPQQPVEITNVKNTPSKDGKSLALSFTAAGQIAPQISVDKVRSSITGKRINDARAALLSGQSGLPHIQNVSITVYPGFVPWVPFWQQRINVSFKAIPAQPVTKPKK